MIDSCKEDMLRLAEVPAIIEELTGEVVNFKTVYRWTGKGKRGVRLETVPSVVGKRTSRQAVLRFVARITGRDADASNLAKAKRRDLAKKDAALAAAGR